MSKFISAQDQVSIFKLAGKLAAKGDEIAFLHIQEACEATTSAKYCDKLQEARIKIYALRADFEARRLTKKISLGVELVDFKQWVNLLMDRHDKIVSWTC